MNNVNNCNLVDLGCSSPRLTWSNNEHVLLILLYGLTMSNLPRSYSDHCIMLILPEGILT